MVKHLLIRNIRYQDESESLLFRSFVISSCYEKIKIIISIIMDFYLYVLHFYKQYSFNDMVYSHIQKVEKRNKNIIH